jgi:hypothetical protein
MASISSLFLLSFFLTPPSIMVCTAIFEVNLSSIKTTVLSGQVFRSFLIKGSTKITASEGILFICFGYPTTIVSTGSPAKAVGDDLERVGNRKPYSFSSVIDGKDSGQKCFSLGCKSRISSIPASAGNIPWKPAVCNCYSAILHFPRQLRTVRQILSGMLF